MGKTVLKGLIGSGIGVFNHVLNLADNIVGEADTAAQSAVKVGSSTGHEAIAFVRKQITELQTAVDELIDSLPIP